MKALFKLFVFLVALGSAGYLVYLYINPPLSDQEKIVKAWEDEYETASRLFVGSGRFSGGTGLDMSTDIDTAVIKIKAIREEIRRKKGALTDADAVRRVVRLEARIQDFLKKNRME